MKKIYVSSIIILVLLTFSTSSAFASNSQFRTPPGTQQTFCVIAESTFFCTFLALDQSSVKILGMTIDRGHPYPDGQIAAMNQPSYQYNNDGTITVSIRYFIQLKNGGLISNIESVDIEICDFTDSCNKN